MSRRRGSKGEPPSILEIFVDPLFGAFGGFLFIFLMVLLLIGVTGRKPEILTERLPGAVKGKPYQVWLSAEGGVGNYHWRFAEDAPSTLTRDMFCEPHPAWLQLDPNGRLFGDPEILNPDLRAVDSSFCVAVEALQLKTENPLEIFQIKKYQIRVLRDAPLEISELTPVAILTEDPLPEATASRPYRLTFAAQGGLAPYHWECEAPEGQWPAGLEFNGTLGTIKGAAETPAAGVELALRVRDSRPVDIEGSMAQGVFHLAILPPPEPPPPPPPPLKITSRGFPPAVQGVEYSVALAAVGGYPPYAWGALGPLPEWIALDPQTGAITGIPPIGAPQTLPLAFTARDTSGAEAAAPLRANLRILQQKEAPVLPLELLSARLPEARRGGAYDALIPLRGGIPPYRLEFEGLPEGLNLAEGPRLNGTLLAEGEFLLKMKVADSAEPPQALEADLLLPCRAETRPLRIVSLDPLPDAILGRRFEFAFAADGGEGPVAWTIKGNPPPGLNWNEGRLAGTPRDASKKPYAMEIEAREVLRAAGEPPRAVSKTFHLTVLPGAPEIKTWKWLWLGAIFFVHMIILRIWQAYCLRNANAE